MRRMKTVGLKMLKDKLSAYVHAAAAGETVLVTDRNRVIAEIGPPSSGNHASSADAILADLVRKGWVTPAKRTSGIPPRLPMMSTKQLMDELDADREDR